MRKISFWFFIAGLPMAVILEAIWYMAGYYTPSGCAVERISLVLWPSAIFKIALDENHSSWLQILFVYSLSFTANGSIYGFIGLLIGIAGNLAAKLRC